MEIQQNPYHLETEKQDLTIILNEFIDSIDFEQKQLCGRPRTDFRDILKCLLITSYYGFSYRRANSDIAEMFYKGYIKSIPKRSTLCKYMLDPETKAILLRLIPLSARTFIDMEDMVIIDSTWFGYRFPISPLHKNNNKILKYNDKSPLDKTRKLHILCFLKSQIIICARVSAGSEHDSKFFKEMLKEAIDNGFKIKCLLGDAGYTGRENYALCEEYGIKDVFINFKKNSTEKRPKSNLWKPKLKLYREHPEIWHEKYRFRVIVENLFSLMKRKGKNYIRCRKSNSQDVELLLKALWHNLTIISKFMDNL